MIAIKDMECEVTIKLHKDNLTYEEKYIFGPVGDKENDFVGMPLAFLNKGLDMFDYEDIAEITLKIKQND